MSASQRRRLILHIGTPKTGTTAVQILLGNRTQELRDYGIFVPLATRGSTPGVGAHHGIVASLLQPDSVAAGDRVSDLLAELDASPAPLAIVSSETLCALYVAPAELASFAAGIAAIGYETTVVVYVRGQSAFAESVYAEFVKQGYAWDAGAYLDAVVERDARTYRDGWSFAFDYNIILDAFSAVFSERNVVVRPYVAGANPRALLDDFWMAGGVPESGRFANFYEDRLHNERASFVDILTQLRANATERAHDAPEVADLIKNAGLNVTEIAKAPFAILDERDIARIDGAFAEPNRRLFERFGLRLASESRASTPQIDAFKRALAAATIAWNLRGTF